MFEMSVHTGNAIRRLKRSDYDTLVSLGAFDGEKIELIRGVLVEMSPVDPKHAETVSSLQERLSEALRGRARIRTQSPIIACDESEPEPDLAIGPAENYGRSHPTQAMLIVEVSGSSLRLDREIKAPLYASSGFQEYWIVNLRDAVVEVHRRPRGDTWTEVIHHPYHDEISPLAFPDVRIRFESVVP